MNTHQLESMAMDDLQAFMNIYENKVLSLKNKVKETELKYYTLEAEHQAIKEVSNLITKTFFERLHQENNNKKGVKK